MNTLAHYFPAVADTAAKATIVLGVAWIAGLLLKNRSAALRHTMRACTLGAVVLLPVEVPLTSGAWHPKIVLSPDHAEWSPLRRDAILHHELAHIRRLDALAQALCHVTIALYWFHPLVWLTVKAMRAEREQACDDYVLASGAKPSEYAHELLEIASSVRQPEFITALAMARRSQLEGRVMALLNPAQRRESISQRTTLTVVLLTLCAVLPLAAIQTATPPQKSPKPRTEATPKATPSTPVANTDVEEPNMPEASAPPVAPPPPESPTPPEPPTPPAPAAIIVPVDRIHGSVPSDIKGGVPGGITGGVQAVPPIPPMPAPPQAAPPAPRLPAAPRAPHPPALPKAPSAAPVPQITPSPEVAPVAPETPSTPPAGTVSPAPKANPVPRAASTAPALDRF